MAVYRHPIALYSASQRLAVQSSPLLKPDLIQTVRAAIQEEDAALEDVANDTGGNTLANRVRKRAERRLRNWITMAAANVDDGTSNPEERLKNVEAFGIEQVEQRLSDALLALCSTQTLLACILALLLCCAPYLIFWATGS